MMLRHWSRLASVGTVAAIGLAATLTRPHPTIHAQSRSPQPRSPPPTAIPPTASMPASASPATTPSTTAACTLIPSHAERGCCRVSEHWYRWSASDAGAAATVRGVEGESDHKQPEGGLPAASTGTTRVRRRPACLHLLRQLLPARQRCGTLSRGHRACAHVGTRDQVMGPIRNRTDTRTHPRVRPL